MTTISPKEFGEVLRSLRKSKGFTTRQLEAYSGVSHSYLSQLENGKRGIPSAGVLLKLYGPLGVPYSDLIRMAGYSTDSREETFVPRTHLKHILRDYEVLFATLTHIHRETMPYVNDNGLLGKVHKASSEALLTLGKDSDDHSKQISNFTTHG